MNLYRNDVGKAANALLNGEKASKRLLVVEHKPLVNILSFALVINHNHFILSSNVKKGISIYMQKLNTSFAKYFNLKYQRQGNLFNKPFKVISIQGNSQLHAVIRYVNIKNPLDVYRQNWREGGIEKEEEVFCFLNNYQFSSFPDLFGERRARFLAPDSELKLLGIKKDKEENIKIIKDYLNQKE